ncbi:hypothetical protein [Actinacidiphila sp. bgisy167]|uniref:hypothetical protein n=1 Tax=Actinacidiphila sp. bgisy167 TaxID=3413797 RepID=UPI003D764140
MAKTLVRGAWADAEALVAGLEVIAGVVCGSDGRSGSARAQRRRRWCRCSLPGFSIDLMCAGAMTAVTSVAAPRQDGRPGTAGLAATAVRGGAGRLSRQGAHPDC